MTKLSGKKSLTTIESIQKPSLLFLLPVLIFAAGSCGSQKIVQSNSIWANSLDAKDDFLHSKINANTLYKSKRFWSQFSNDGKNLYLTFLFTDKNDQKRIFTEDAILWINLEGKREKKSGIVYPYRTDKLNLMYRMNGEDKCNSITSHLQPEDKFKNKERLLLFNLNTVGKVVEINHLNNNSVKANIMYDQNSQFLIYKLIIPFEVLPTRSKREVDVPEKVTVGFEIDQPCPPAYLDALAWRKGIPGRPGGSNPPISSDRSVHYSSDMLFWTEIHLSKKK